ncbi:selenocysteine-specific translation elongation factor [Brachyspira hyodysenteriae]|uniref:selenocysteine-specific translation elongation factor n=1 Tax=Brachyspira hyodysenteriae TaxID=159 RepID=UPI00063DA324|nr:selenocysteine-specific translation elongation factor [Brachyspira hyodysenteriae]KLI15457.1 translation elongation factor [Brachyspira hyodysenteriae]MBT8719363.1 selenocysteine-specific translation elongation factor [Brachyspira hyodysenteriae]MBT8729605.1 selenocysteine-specific translation elongation factor [Brachyspira hyodysenteriae]MBT8732276.1 selenocysteine-specific translation elongation factor [Brachyspira hyodysenteriae]MBT8734859.1 selenocysteine-specific translation elongation
MNKIIGTAGHVDHGKSQLIKALTGISMMRLPEEQKREMTIDLGFGFFKPNDDITIGVIDVPGHERFIRNMVAGMWSLDLVMLVVCANEGWMNMTEEHAKVALSLGIRNIVCVINKIDLVDDDKLKESEEYIKKNLYRIFNKDIEIVKVSALNGTNIDFLKDRITDILSNEKYEDDIKTHIYVDRVFSIKGAGLTVTGSLRGGNIKKDDTLIHYPSKKEISIRNIQSYHEDKEIVYSASRIAINIKNIKKEEIRRGHLLCCKEEKVFSTDEIILELINTNDAEYLKKIKNAEFAVGTECLIAQILPIYKNKTYSDKDNKNNKEIDNRFIRLKFDETISVFWKERGILISHGGSSIIAAGNVFWGEKTNPFIRKRIIDNAGKFLGEVKREKYNDLFMSVNGYTEASGEIPDYTIKVANFFVKKDYLNSLLERLKNLIENKKEGISFEDIRNYLNINNAFTKVFIDYSVENQILMPFNNIYKKYNEEITLNNSQKILLEKLKKEDLNGLDEKTIRTFTNGMKDIKVLSASKKAMYLDEGIYYHIDVYNRIKKLILQNTKTNDIITIAAVRDKTGLSRKYVLPILNAFEREKLVRREGSERIVL